MHNPVKIQCKSAHAGGGKSRTIFDVSPDKPTIIATPTDALTVQYGDYFKNAGIKATLISRLINPERSSRQHLLEAVASSKKLIVVTQTIVHECQADLSAYRIFEDEIVNPVECLKFENAQHIRSLFKTLLDAEISVAPRYYRLKLTAAAIEIALGGWNHAVIKDSSALLNLCKAGYSLHHDVYVLVDAYHRYLDGEQNDIQFWSVLKPSVHQGRDVTSVGALFETSMLKLIWDQSADLIESDLPIIDKGLTHNAALADICYVSEKSLTGTLLAKVGAKTVFRKVAEYIDIEHPNRPYIYTTNKTKGGGRYPWKTPKPLAEFVAPMAHGQNAYEDLDMAVYLATQFYDPATYKFLNEVFGLDSRDVWKAFTFERFYQFALRICARRRDNTKPFTIIAPDLDCALELSRLFGCNKEPRILDLGFNEFREETMKKQPMDAAERKRKSREKQKMAKEDHETTEQYDDYRMIFWGSKYAKELMTKSMSWFELAGFLEHQHENYSSKSKSNAVCFREGDILDETNHKLVGNIRSTKLVILDMDIVKRDPKDLSDFLAENGWSHLVFNSFSSTPLEPHIRVVIGLDEAVNPANYLQIVNLLKADIAARFGDDVYVVDDSKITINAKFHSPSVSQFKSALFIKRNIVNDGQFTPRFLNVRWFLSRNSVGGSKPVAANTNTTRLAPVKDAIEDIIDQWSVAPGQGKGSYNFHQAAVDLKKAGVGRDDCIAILTQNRHRFGHGADRDAVYVVGRVFGKAA